MGRRTSGRTSHLPCVLGAPYRAVRTHVVGNPRVRAVRQRFAWRVMWPRAEPLAHPFPPGHFYSPVPSTRDVDDWRPTDPAGEMLGIALRVEEQVAFLSSLDVTMPAGPRFADNIFYDTGDAAIYQAILRAFDPARVVEVGGGWSTAALFDTAVSPAVTVIDPDPSRVHALLRPEDFTRCTVRAERLQDVDLAPFLALEAGDIVFVDSTHVSKLGSDVNRLVFEVLPRLARGVSVHFHDVHFPFDYPQHWVRRGRHWNEAYLLRAFLQHNDAFEILLWADLLHRLGRIEDARLDATIAGAHSAAIWIRRR